MRKRRVVVLGATGSIGQSAARVADDLPERMEIAGLSAHRNAVGLAAQANHFRPASRSASWTLHAGPTSCAPPCSPTGYRPTLLFGEEGLVELAATDGRRPRAGGHRRHGRFAARRWRRSRRGATSPWQARKSSSWRVRRSCTRRRRMGRPHPARGQRAQRHFPMPRRPRPGKRPAVGADGVRRPVPSMDPRFAAASGGFVRPP